jgi:lysozyme
MNWKLALQLCMELLKQFEGFKAEPYLDSAGIPTIGYGTIRYPNGYPVLMTDRPITREEGLDYMRREANNKIEAIDILLKRPVTTHQAAAMLSLTYNIGATAFRNSTTLRRFNARDFVGAADAFLLWDKAHVDGRLVVVDGLHNRRVAERKVFITPDTEEV